MTKIYHFDLEEITLDKSVELEERKMHQRIRAIIDPNNRIPIPIRIAPDEYFNENGELTSPGKHYINRTFEDYFNQGMIKEAMLFYNRLPLEAKKYALHNKNYGHNIHL